MIINTTRRVNYDNINTTRHVQLLLFCVVVCVVKENTQATLSKLRFGSSKHLKGRFNGTCLSFTLFGSEGSKE